MPSSKNQLERNNATQNIPRVDPSLVPLRLSHNGSFPRGAYISRGYIAQRKQIFWFFKSGNDSHFLKMFIKFDSSQWLHTKWHKTTKHGWKIKRLNVKVSMTIINNGYDWAYNSQNGILQYYQHWNQYFQHLEIVRSLAAALCNNLLL